MKPVKKIPPKMRNEEKNESKADKRKESKMSPKQLSLFESYEMKGAKIARKK